MIASVRLADRFEARYKVKSAMETSTPSVMGSARVWSEERLTFKDKPMGALLFFDALMAPRKLIGGGFSLALG